MLSYIIRRSLYMIIIMLVVSVVAFTIIQLPPGDYLTSVIGNLRRAGIKVDEEQIRSLEERYSLDLPVYAQYFKWMWNMFHG
ncbi:ABC transporter permease, partial [Candidatus Aerophobetes bacterium Ae_b3a]